jgi:hypothetical protein
MADISITASAVLATATTKFQNLTAGATITAGQVVYLDSSDGECKLADASAAATSNVKGIAMHASLDGQPLRVATGGNLTMDGMTSGELYVLSATAGGIAPAGDLTGNEFNVVIGSATTATNLEMNIQAFTTTQRSGAIT